MAVEIRSYRNVFDLERRIYRVDRLRLNPGGVPVRGVVYFLALLLASLLAGVLPLLRVLVVAAPWYLRDLLLPAGCAALLSAISIEGRPFHLAGRALIRYALGPRHLSGARRTSAPGRRWQMQEVALLVDGSDARLRSLRYAGPGRITVVVAHERVVWCESVLSRLARRPQITLCELPQGHAPSSRQTLSLASGCSVQVLRAGARAGTPARRARDA